MWFGALGPLLVRSEDGSEVAVGPRQRRALLSRLLIDANRVVTSDALVDALWGEFPPSSAAGSLQAHISRLRATLGEQTLITRPPGYLLTSPHGSFDVSQFERLTVQGRQAVTDGQTEQAASLLDKALRLWRGDAYVEFADLEFARPEAVRLRELRLGVLEDRISADLELGHHLPLISELETLTKAHPFREGLTGSLMLALYRSGRQRDALTVYQQRRKLLGEELGIEPTADLRHLEEQILLQDPALSPSSPIARTHRQSPNGGNDIPLRRYPGFDKFVRATRYPDLRAAPQRLSTHRGRGSQ